MKSINLLLLGITFLPVFSASAAKASTPKVMDQQAVFDSVTEGNTKVLSSFLKDKKNLNVKDASGNSLLIIAAQNGQKEAVKMLIENKADINLKNDDNQTALYQALMGPSPETALELIKAGANLEDIDDEGDSALLIASSANIHEAMKLIIKMHKDSVNKPVKDGTTPLMEAAKYGDSETISILLHAGANTRARNQNGRSPLELATKAKNTEAIKLLSK